MSVTRMLRGLSARLTAPLESLDAVDLAGVVQGIGSSPVESAQRGQLVTLAGRVRTVLSGGGEQFLGVTAEVYDGTGAVDVCWLGRRSIPGIDTGRFVKVTGRIGVRAGQKIMFNPRYELLSGQPGAGRGGEV
ncbi:OB-fold nucleic acid binding domain-containing protein [Dietzia sp. SLG310A2-38A2]|uniref:OB-fold nucleic acid binding domain-containing protein n=1 Tax=Dietzia sp. SLG310A2-38A2 TaxID=1630643 RepID=UPI0015FBFB85|nr:OB-fold nucleic acid binding domain-containing protein [Dietzia sp. SLG310A2-38A2]MBB1032573.1 OB-fold nucleic acid binding domain-containing protein [Dietzia sp. SLG310A2-38A2]